MKKENNEHTCEVFHFDLYGARKEKYAFLQNNSLQTVEWQQLNPQAPNYFFVPKDFSLQEEYEKGFKIDELMKIGAVGIVSSRDDLVIKFEKNDIEHVISDFKTLSKDVFRNKYNIQDSRDWTYERAKNDLVNAHVYQITYRPFDKRYILYSSKSKGILSYPRDEVMRHFILGVKGQNIGLIAKRGFVNELSAYGFITDSIYDRRAWTNPGMQGSEQVFPLYIYPQEGSYETERRVNMDEKIMQRIAEIIEVVNASERCKENNSTQRLEALFTPSQRLETLTTKQHSETFTNVMPNFVDTEQHINIKTDSLPHWHQPGKTQFVTFRLADSLPQEKLQELQLYKDEWQKNHPLPWDEKTKQEYEYEVRHKTDKWLDNGYGSCILSRPDIRKIVTDALLHYNGELYYLHHFVVMPNHVHLLITPFGENTVNKALGSVKRFAANEINKVLGTKGEIWQRIVFDHLVRNQNSYNAFVSYIKDNPKNLPLNTFTLYDGDIVGNASERCKEDNSTQRLEALTTESQRSEALSTEFQRSEALTTNQRLETLATNIFDYIYGILHSPTYRERYKEFLKIDFPRIPYPKDKTDFEHFRKFGEQLRHIHLMEPDALAELEKQYPTLATYDQQGNNIVEQIIYNSDGDTSSVQINDTQFFANVPSEAWEFYIGGYQPAQKWLKDRKDRVLSFDDIAHYRHIIMILVETNRIMQQIQ